MDRKKAQSEIIGVILILGITFASIGVILLLGQPVLSDATNDATVDRVQNEMITLDARLTAAAQGTSVNESLSFSLEGGELTSDADATRLNVTLEDGTGTVVYNKTIGNIEYENGETAVAYEAGGIWRRNTLTGASFMVSPPDFDFDGETMTLPIYNVTTDAGYGGSQTLSVRGGNKTRYYPNTDKNPVNGNVLVTVETEYYRAWERYFEDELRGNATVNESANEVTAELLAYETPDSIDWAGASKAEGTGPLNNVFGSFEDGVEFPSVDSEIESYVEYGESNIDSSAVEDLNSSFTGTYDESPGVYYNATDYTMGDGGIEDIDADSGNVTVVVDGDLTVDNLDAAVDTGTDSLTIVTTGDLIFPEGYNIQIGNSEVPRNLIFLVPSDREVIFEGGGGDGYGTVYAPDSLVSLSQMGEGSGSEWTGPVVGKVFDAGGVDPDAEITLGGSSVPVRRADSGIDLYVTERNVGIE